MTETGVDRRTSTRCGRTRRTSCSPTTRCSTCCSSAARTCRSSPARASRCATSSSTSSTPTTARRARTSRCCCAGSALALGVTTDERPLGAITPVATSATLGGGSDGGPKLREFAETVFGAEFDAASLVGEDRLTVEEWATGSEPAASRCSTGSPRRYAGARRTRRSCARVCALFGPDENAADLDPQGWGSGCARTRSPTACCSSRRSPCR